ncbi:hypothetical protein FHX42_001052 [Saccharopolyspora lacisalsi]|uniref:VOC domain-containing protein n=1 Tax=Halosaccharopolyspora lacisalsi TaxID=1000566 RepID=A0A839DRM2_9PSEU|nr:VOC family protein [Halosaccharopolyspora lacisalsi]MBA8823723.1 hypothetical protein [Halosaccharopolyspora lacisalsi]
MPPSHAVRGLRRAELITIDPEAAVRFHRALLDWLVLPSEEGIDCWVGERRCAVVREPGDGERPGWSLVFAGSADDDLLRGPAGTCATTAKGRVQHGPWAPKPRRGEPCWVELCTEDADEADAFWSERLNWSATRNSADTTYSVEDRPIASRAARPELGDRAAWSCYFVVTDLDRAAEQVRELGGSLLGRFEHPVVGEAVLIADLEGAVCALTGKTESWGG